MARPKANSDALALYRAILAHPDEDTPRLVYADWLQENGQPERAEFIRLQCRLARMNEWDDGYTADRLRAERLHREHWPEWVPPPGRAKWTARYPGAGFRPVRGFPGHVNFTRLITPDEARRWFAPHPIAAADVHLVDPPAGQFAGLWRVTADSLPHLRTLVLDGEHECSTATLSSACRTLAESASRSGLTRLEIFGEVIPLGLKAVVTSPHLRRLEALSVRGNDFDASLARLLADETSLPALRELILGHGPSLSPVGAEALGRAEWLDRLHVLRLYGFRNLGARGVKKLIGDRALPELRILHVHHCEQNGADLVLAGSRQLPGLVELISAGSYATAEDIRALVRGPQRFKSLDLPGVLGVPDVAAVFAKPAVRDLRRLVWSEHLSTAAVAALAASPAARSLRWLELSCAWEADPAGVLLDGPEWPHLERLVLKSGVPGERLLALIESDKFPRLVSLSVGCRDGWAKFLKRLAKSPGAAKFRELALGVAMTPATVRELADSPHLDGIDRLVVSKGTASPVDCARLVTRFGKRIEISRYHG